MSVSAVRKRHHRHDSSAPVRCSGGDFVLLQAVGHALRLQTDLDQTAYFGICADRPCLHRRNVLLGRLRLEGFVADRDRDLERRFVGRVGPEARPVDVRTDSRTRFAEFQLSVRLIGDDRPGSDDTHRALRTSGDVNLFTRILLAARGCAHRSGYSRFIRSVPTTAASQERRRQKRRCDTFAHRPPLTKRTAPCRLFRIHDSTREGELPTLSSL